MKEVKVEVHEDDVFYYGHALITFHSREEGNGPVKLFVSRKSADKPYLGLSDWQASPLALDVEVISRDGATTVVRAGPEICDRIPYDLQVRFQLAGSEVFGQVFWPSIQPVPGGYTGHLDVRGINSAPTAPDPPPSVPMPPPPLPLPVPTPQPPEPTAPRAEAEVVSPPPRKKRLVPSILLLLLVACAVGGYLYWPQLKQAVIKYMADTGITAPPVKQKTLAERFEELRSGDPKGVGLLALSREAFAARDGAIGQQAISLAIQRGNQEAKLEMGKWYDPRTFAPDRAVSIDANRAARAYFELALSDNAEAKRLLLSLCEASNRGGPNYQGFLGSTYCQGSLGR